MTTKIVVWDSIGNTLLGVRPWDSWEPHIKEEMLRERPDAQTAAITDGQSSPTEPKPPRDARLARSHSEQT